ncbi:hypothetical protein EMIHUDRAFT_120335, partial [Emiliania huxleyi CCMP1516]|uniref:Uncharacterized protein n=2 Tax=Emiliania huxleyi TaxID=2903 RepID=A0A0D3IJN3_EMIH1
MKELFWAARHGRVAEIGEALAAGADIDWRHPVDGRTPLGAAAAFDQLEALEALLAGGAALEARESETGLTPLGVAVLEGSARCLGALLRAGADVDATDADGWTPLMHAAARNQLFEAQSLKAAGASLGANVDGVGARELAASEGHDAVLALLSQAQPPSAAKLESSGPAAAATTPQLTDSGAAVMASAPIAALLQEGVVGDAALAASAAVAGAAMSGGDGGTCASTAEGAAANGASTCVDAGAAGGERGVKRARCAAPVSGQAAAMAVEVLQDGDDIVVQLHSNDIARLSISIAANGEWQAQRLPPLWPSPPPSPDAPSLR